MITTDAIEITPAIADLFRRLQEHDQQRPHPVAAAVKRDVFDQWFDTRRELYEELGELVARRAMAGQ